MSRFETSTTLRFLVHILWVMLVVGVSSCSLYEDIEPLDRTIAVDTLQISPNPVRLELGQSTQLTATSFDQAGEEVEGLEVEWSSGNTSVATIDQEGVVEAKSVGDTTVSARIGEITATVTVVVFTAVQRVDLEPDPAEVDVGGSLQMTARVYGDNDDLLTGRNIAWSSSDESIATVDADGQVSGVSEGDATIRARTGGVTGTATVRVRAPIDRVELDQSEATIEVAQTLQLNALVYDVNDTLRDDRIVTWSSSQPDVASVDETGLVEGLKGGTTIISAESGGERAEATVVVEAPVADVEISPSPAAVGVERTLQLTAALTDAAGNELSGREITWASDDESIATVDDDGLVHGIVGGQVTVSATSEGVSDTVQVSVENPVQTVEVSPDPVTIAVPDTQQMTVVLRDAGGNEVSGRSVTWRSEDASVASVDANGVVTAKDAGTANITATAEGVTGSALVTVENPVATVEVTPAAPSVEVAQTTQLTATAKNSSGSVVTGHPVTWSSSDPSIATVDANGQVEGLRGGTATIDAQVDNITGSVTVTVVDPVRTVTLSAPATTLEVTETTQLSAELFDNGGNALSGRAINWTSDDDSVASVDAGGLVAANAGGTATITAESEGASDSVTITVENPPRSVEVTPNPAAVDVADTVQLDATVRDLGGNVLSGYSASWSSSDDMVATVDANGLVSGQKGGSVVVTASVDDGSGNTLTGTAQVDVDAPVAVVEVVPTSVELFPGEQAQLDVRLEDAAGNTLSGRSVSWSSQDTSIATVNHSGLVVSLTPGATTITAESEGVSATATVEVLEWIDISAGDGYSCGVLSNGDAYCWGQNSEQGVLGDGTSDSGTQENPVHDADKSVPTLVLGGHDFAQISAGYNHTCALTATGKAYCWGFNGGGHLGDGTYTHSATPVAVSGTYTFTDISLGANHTCALETSGDLYCWGANTKGQLGVGAPVGQFNSVPQRLAGMKFTSVSTGTSHTCAIAQSGETYCWGEGSMGQLGNNNGAAQTSPVLVDTAEQFVLVASGWSHSCGINTSGSVYCWGENNYGGLGDGTTTMKMTPVLAESSRTYVDLALGAGATCAVDTNGDAYCWGFNGQGNLGNGSLASVQHTATLVSGGYGWSDLALGRQHSCGRTPAQTDALCWGDNDWGQIGNGANQNYLSAPVDVLNP